MISGNFYLSYSDMIKNGKEFDTFMSGHNFNIYARCAMLGNIQEESGINPGIWEYLKKGNLSGGYGLTQWTPATKIINWLNENGYEIDSGIGQMLRIVWEKDNEQQWGSTSGYPLTFHEFATYTNSSMTDEEICKYLANAFLRNYERPQNQNQPKRGINAYEWFKILNGIRPIEPEPGEPIEPEQPIEEPWYNIIYVLDNNLLKCVGNKEIIITKSQCKIINEYIIKLKKEISGGEKTFKNIGYRIYKRIDN